MARRIVAATVLLFVFLSCAWAAQPQQEATPRFEPIQVVSAVGAVYPLNSLGNGTLVLRVTVDGAGKIKKIDVLYGIQSLTQDAELAVREWKFKPAILNGKPVTTSMIAAFTYGTWPFANAFGSPRPQEHEENHATSFFTPVKVVIQAAAAYPFTSHAAGTVVLDVTIDEAGAIKTIDVLHDIPSLTEPSEKAIRKWKFKPAMLDGKPVTTSMVASFAFRIPSWHR